MQRRILHAMSINLRSDTPLAVIIWPKDLAKVCLRLVNPRTTWLSAAAGDPVELTHQGEKRRHVIESVELYRVYPTEFIGQTVSTAGEWLNAGTNPRG